VCSYLWKATGQENGNLEKRKREFGWTLRKDDGEIRKAAITLGPSGKQKDRKTKK
jgi:hypothetical protein